MDSEFSFHCYVLASVYQLFVTPSLWGREKGRSGTDYRRMHNCVCVCVCVSVGEFYEVEKIGWNGMCSFSVIPKVKMLHLIFYILFLCNWTKFLAGRIFHYNKISNRIYFIKLEILIYCFHAIWKGGWPYFCNNLFFVVSVFIVMRIYCINWQVCV